VVAREVCDRADTAIAEKNLEGMLHLIRLRKKKRLLFWARPSTGQGVDRIGEFARNQHDLKRERSRKVLQGAQARIGLAVLNLGIVSLQHAAALGDILLSEP